MSSSSSTSTVSRLSAFMKPLDWVNTATTAVRNTVPHLPKGADGPLDWVQQCEKCELKPGDHIYAWKIGYTYNHHGIVVHNDACPPDCPHDQLHCCSIVHFRPPAGNNPGCIELVPLAAFTQGRGLCLCRYGVPNAEFYLRRAGSCSTFKSDPWPLTILRALSLLEVCGCASDTEDARIAAEVEYNMLRKNAELLAVWSKVGSSSGVERFRSRETAYSPQTSPGRFVRLGLAVAVPTAAVIGGVALATAGGTATVGAGASVAGSTAAKAGATTVASTATVETGTAMGASAVGGIAARLASTSNVLKTAGVVAAAAGREAIQELLVDIARRPQQARNVMSQVWETMPTLMHRAPQLARYEGLDGQRRYHQEQQEAFLTAFKKSFDYLGVQVPKVVAPLLDDPLASGRLCEILVDVLEEAEPHEERGCSALIQHFLRELDG